MVWGRGRQGEIESKKETYIGTDQERLKERKRQRDKDRQTGRDTLGHIWSHRERHTDGEALTTQREIDTETESEGR